ARVADVRESLVEPRDQRRVERIPALGPGEPHPEHGPVPDDVEHAPAYSPSSASPRRPSSDATETVASRSKTSAPSGSWPISSRARDGSGWSAASRDSQTYTAPQRSVVSSEIQALKSSPGRRSKLSTASSRR